jgi:hypothetical protein
VQGVQLRERVLVPWWLGRIVMWLFFRTDTAARVTLSGFFQELPR